MTNAAFVQSTKQPLIGGQWVDYPSGPHIDAINLANGKQRLRLAGTTCYRLGGGVRVQSLATLHVISLGTRMGTMWINCYSMIDLAKGFGRTLIRG
jgi:acyl-CoA reductase-like NAD-dependent aldehyde dehydrogenase